MWRRIALSILLFLTTGCFRPRPATVPMRTVEIKPGAPGSRSLVVLLPGRFDKPEDFARAGFGELAEKYGVGARIVSADAHLGYYLERTVVERLRQDVIAPARADRVWLAGVSLGGTGSVLYSIEHPEEVAGITLIAPFLGEDDVRKEIEAAGGLRSWTPPQVLSPTDFQRRMWVWFQHPDPKIPVYLGWGTRDRFAKIDGLLGAVLPPERVFTTPGGHAWKPWRALWERFLATGALKGF
ncbi:MAG TPA: alpha/beta hydrolase [Thermoanaerobaculia bacterium]|jgi:pimeloyl-ACP methyl ester carboxylesterase|nr:alpha/beta hydrolase [Thermoanaerobaculia bacterium]